MVIQSNSITFAMKSFRIGKLSTIVGQPKDKRGIMNQINDKTIHYTEWSHGDYGDLMLDDGVEMNSNSKFMSEMWFVSV